MRLRRIAMLALTAAAVAAVAALAACGGGHATPTVSPQQFGDLAVDVGTALDTPAPDFALTDQFGQPVSLSQFRGRVVVMAFIDSECTTICPLTTESMRNAVRLLPADQRTNVVLLGVNANPRATAVSDAKAYSIAHGIENAWRFATGTPAQLEAVWKAYSIDVQVRQGEIDHTPALYVIDPQGRERRLFLTSMQFSALAPETWVLAQAVADQLPGHPSVSQPSDVVHLPPAMTAATAPSLPNANPAAAAVAGATPIVLGSGEPRLAIFFATWVPGAAQALADLGTYGGADGGLPPLVAVDIGNTEPSADALPTFLANAPSRIALPIVVDARGAIADAYGVEDLPWITLTSATGEVLWSHAGFEPADQLARDVKAALGG